MARPLPSIPSAAGCPALVGDFAGTTGLSDFPCPFIIGVCPRTSRHDPQHHLLRVDTGPPGSRARCFRTCTGSLTARDRGASRDIDASRVAFRLLLRRRRPGGSYFRGSIPGLHVPLSTLRSCPYEQQRMTRGRRGPLTLQRMTLSFTTPRRFIPAHSRFPHASCPCTASTVAGGRPETAGGRYPQAYVSTARRTTCPHHPVLWRWSCPSPDQTRTPHQCRHHPPLA